MRATATATAIICAGVDGGAINHTWFGRSAKIPLMAWFKMIGSTETPVVGDWAADRRDLLGEIRFPWNKPPSDIWSPGQLIIYAVGAGSLIAIQEVNGPPQLRPRRGAPGTVENRWPHKLAVKTTWFCSPVEQAPKLREEAPKFAAKYESRFWNGSHWPITSEEYAMLAGIVCSAGKQAT